MKKKIRISGNRTIIGIICIVLALLITFGVAPLVNRLADQKVNIVRLRNDVERGHIITAEDIEIAKVGAYNLPDNVIKDGNAVVGKYAATDLYAGDYLFYNKLSTVAISTFAGGLSDKLENGDIVSVIIYDKEKYTSYIPAELKYVRVITATTGDGIDKDEASEGGKSATVTVLVTPEQAELLAQYNSVTTLHFALVYRGSREQADEYIKVQDEYLNSGIENSPEAEEEING